MDLRSMAGLGALAKRDVVAEKRAAREESRARREAEAFALDMEAFEAAQDRAARARSKRVPGAAPYEELRFECVGHRVCILAHRVSRKAGRALVSGLVNVVVDGRAWIAGCASGFERLAVGREVHYDEWEEREAKARRAFNFMLPLAQDALVLVKFVSTARGRMEVGCAQVVVAQGQAQAHEISPV